VGGSSKSSTQTQTIPAQTTVTPVQRTVSVVVGYKYYLGAHMALTHGPVDFVSRIKVGDKCAWSGLAYGQPDDSEITNINSSGVRINISANNLFGGVDGEGGVSGPVDFLQGYTTQAVNDYLAARLGGSSGTPAFRGVTSMVLRQTYVSANNPYLKPWQFTMTRTDVGTYGAEQWYVEKARIGVVSDGVAVSPGEGLESNGEYTVLAVFNGDSTDKLNFRFDPIEGIEDYEVLIVGAGGRTNNGFGLSGTYASGGAGGGQVIHRSVKITEPLINTSASGSESGAKIYPAGPTTSSTAAALTGESSFFRLPGETIEAKGGSGSSLSTGYTGSGGGANNTTVQNGFCGTSGTCGGDGAYTTENFLNAGYGGGGASQGQHQPTQS